MNNVQNWVVVTAGLGLLAGGSALAQQPADAAKDRYLSIEARLFTPQTATFSEDWLGDRKPRKVIEWSHFNPDGRPEQMLVVVRFDTRKPFSGAIRLVAREDGGPVLVEKTRGFWSIYQNPTFFTAFWIDDFGCASIDFEATALDDSRPPKPVISARERLDIECRPQ